MAIDFENDLDVFMADFGQSCTYTDNIGVSHGITAMRLSDQEVFEKGLGDLSIEGTNPVLMCKTSDVADMSNDNSVIWENRLFRVIQKLPDPQSGDGKFTVVFLSNDYL